MKPKVHIIVLNWNNWQDTIECLDSIFGLRYDNFQVLAVDNGSTDGSEEKIKEWAKGKSVSTVRYNRETAEQGGLPEKEKGLAQPSIVLIQTKGNLGYAGGNNVGMRYALNQDDCKYVWLLNNDTIIDRDALTEMVEMAETDEKVGKVGSKLLYHDRPNILQATGGCNIVPWMGNTSTIAADEEDDGRWDEAFEPGYISGASLLVRKEVVERIGLMEDKYFLYWEDADWGVRARRKGYRLLYCPKSKVWHKEGGTSGYLSLKTDYYWIRNGLYFTKKFYPYYLPLIPFSYLAKYALVRMLKNQPSNLKSYANGITDFLRGKTGPV